MQFIKQLFAGMGALFSVTTPPLYRYPYRNNVEGIRGDIGRVSKDISQWVDRED